MDIRVHRSWMYNRFLPGKTDYTQEFVAGVYHFIQYVKTTSEYQIEGAARCPCRKCENRKFLNIENVHEHILRRGFLANYWYWTSHGEERQQDFGIPISSASTSADPSNEQTRNNYENMVFDQMMGQHVTDFEQVPDMMGSRDRDFEEAADTRQFNREDVPNPSAQKFYDMLNAAHRPLCECSDAQTELSMGVQLMSVKSDYNMSRLNAQGERQWSDARSETLHGAYVAAHETPTEDGASSGPPPSLQVQIERWAAIEGSKKKGRVFGLAGLGAQMLPGASSSSRSSQREMQLHSDLEAMRQKMSQVEEQYGAVEAKLERYDAMEAKLERYDALEAKVASFEQMSAQMSEFMRMAQMSQGLSTNFPPPATGLPFPSTVTPLASIGQTSGRPASGITFRPPRSPDPFEQNIDSDSDED